MQVQVVVNTTTTNPIQDEPFWSCSRLGVLFSPKIRHIYPTIIKLGTVIPYLEKIQKIYK